MKENGELQNLRKDLPLIIARHQVDKYLGGLISRGHLQNLDSAGLGPKRILIGRKVGYLREDFLEWLISRMQGGDAK